LDSIKLRSPTVNITIDEYQKLSNMVTPNPTYVKNILNAFWVGGIICGLAQIIINLYVWLGVEKLIAQSAGTATMIFIGALLTGFGVYDEIGRIGGAGSIVPVTGFSNSMVSPALEYKREGYVLGVGSKLFSIAGPVLVFGITASIIVGIIYFLIK